MWCADGQEQSKKKLSTAFRHELSNRTRIFFFSHNEKQVFTCDLIQFLVDVEYVEYLAFSWPSAQRHDYIISNPFLYSIWRKFL